jgi:hypothetical protein
VNGNISEPTEELLLPFEEKWMILDNLNVPNLKLSFKLFLSPTVFEGKEIKDSCKNKILLYVTNSMKNNSAQPDRNRTKIKANIQLAVRWPAGYDVANL